MPKVKHKREKYENDRIILRQLLSNIERNRMRIRKDLLEPSKDEHNVNISSLSHSRKIAIKSIKEKIDDQAKVIEDEET